MRLTVIIIYYSPPKSGFSTVCVESLCFVLLKPQGKSYLKPQIPQNSAGESQAKEALDGNGSSVPK